MQDLIEAVFSLGNGARLAEKPQIWQLCGLWHTFIHRYMSTVESFSPDAYKRRKEDYERGTRLAWINYILKEAECAPVESSTRLSWEVALAMTRWLEGRNPYHDEEYPPDLAQSLLSDRTTQLYVFLLEYAEHIEIWEEKSKEKRYEQLEVRAAKG